MFHDQKVITSIEIQAPAHIVWDIFVDFASYPDWNPFLPRVFGKAGPGETVLEFVYIADHIYMPIPMEIVEYDLHEKIAWRGAVPGIMTWISYGHHDYEIRATKDGACIFRHRAILRGLMMSLGAKHIEQKVRPVHAAMNRALKERAEAMHCS